MMDETMDVMDMAEQEPVKQETKTEDVVWTEESARKALEEAREAENKAYHGMNRAILTGRQKGVLELAKLEEEENPDKETLDKKCKLLLESYYLPHILKAGHEVKLNKEFTRHEGEPEKDYIEAVFTAPSGKTKTVGYNYKVDRDGKNIILFEKTFQTVILKPGDPEKYVLYDADGETEVMTYSMEELEKKVSRGDIVKVEDEYFRKATNADGDVRPGEVTMIVEEDGPSNVKVILGNNEQEKYSFSKTGQLVKATTNDVTTVTIQTRKIQGPGPIFDSVEAAKSAAAKEMQSGETNLRVDVAMEGTTVAEFDFLPVYTTSIELVGLSKKIGKGVEDYDPEVSDEENLRKQLAKPIIQYLDEKGYHVLDISCENLTADVKENVGWINTMKTYQMTGGVVIVTYIKKHSTVVSLKQGFLGRGQGADESAVRAQLPAGSELLNPQDIDWKNSKPMVTYVSRNHATGIGSAKSTNEADDAAAQNAIAEGQKMTVKGLNGGIASGIREAIDAKGGVSTVANVRARLDTAVVSKNDMELSRREPKYAYTASCDKMVSNVENRLVSVTTWNGSKLTYVAATDPIVDKGIPTDENYDKYVNEGDDLGILLFEKNDKGFHRYKTEVQNSQEQVGLSITMFAKARARLKAAQEKFDELYDAKMAELVQEAEEEVAAPEEALVEEPVEAVEEPVIEVAESLEEVIEPDTTNYEEVVEEQPVEEAPRTMTAQQALAEIFGEPAVEEAPRTMTAQEALSEIFGESVAEEADVSESVAEVAPVEETFASVSEQSQEDIDDAFAKLLSGDL